MELARLKGVTTWSNSLTGTFFDSFSWLSLVVSSHVVEMQITTLGYGVDEICT
jgi:hypothetical protein